VSTIVNPLRKLLRRVQTFVGTVEAIDLDARRVRVSHGLDGHAHELPYGLEPAARAAAGAA
jgi:NADH dehydrogenase FAD-containing subunit